MDATPSPRRILHVEDNELDAELVRDLLEAEWPGCKIVRVQDRDAFQAAFSSGSFDLVLSDFSMPQFDGLTALTLARARDSATPFIFLSGTIGEDNAVRALHRGATDYVIKDRPGRLVPAIRRALEAAREQALRQDAERRLREQAGLLDRTRDLIAVIDLDGRLSFWNAGATRLLGWEREEARGRSAVEVFGPGAAAMLAAVAGLRADDEWRGMLEANRQGGAAVTLDARATVVADDRGAPKGHLVIGTDVTAQLALERRFLQAQRLESLGILAGGIAHDLNNVLAPMMMAVGLIGRKTEDPGLRHLAGVLETSAQHGADLVKQVLTFARGAPGERRPVQVAGIVGEVVKLLKETLPRSIVIETDVEKLPDILADTTHVSQVLMNLGVNARDAMPEGGRLVIRARPVTVGAEVAQARGTHPGPHVILAVEDTGTGIPREVIDRIFDPFFTTKAAGKGTGLGLSAVLGIMRTHGGFVDVASEPGRGTVFSLYFPVPEAAPAPRAAAAGPKERVVGNGDLLLLVDDEPAIRLITESVLRDHGFRVVTAEDGLAATALFLRHRDEIRVVVTDLMMPAMSGKDLIGRLHGAAPDVRIVALSGLLEERDGLAEIPGKLKFLHKPVREEELLAAIDSVRPR